MKLVFTPEAEHQATEMDSWWREHRPAARALFARELAEAGELIARTPAAGAVYTTKRGRQFRRILMPKTKNHLYFEVDEARGLVTSTTMGGLIHFLLVAAIIVVLVRLIQGRRAV